MVCQLHQTQGGNAPVCGGGTSRVTRVAVCLGGAVRTFTHEALHSSWHNSIANGFSGAVVTGFGYIKTSDARGDLYSQALKTDKVHEGEHEQDRMKALEHLLDRMHIPASRRRILDGRQIHMPPNCTGYSTVVTVLPSKPVS